MPLLFQWLLYCLILFPKLKKYFFGFFFFIFLIIIFFVEFFFFSFLLLFLCLENDFPFGFRFAFLLAFPNFGNMSVVFLNNKINFCPFPLTENL